MKINPIKLFILNKKAAPHFVRLLLCSLLYSMACTLTQLFVGPQSALLLLFNMIWSLFLYFIINLTWPKTIKQILLVLAWQISWLALYYLLIIPLYSASDLACQLASGILLIFWGPCLIAWMKTVQSGKPLKKVMTYLNAGLFNRYCAVVLIIALLDTLTGGMYTLNAPVPAFRLLSVLLFQGDPMQVPTAWAFMGLYAPAAMSLIMSCIQAWLESCVIAYGTKRP